MGPTALFPRRRQEMESRGERTAGTEQQESNSQIRILGQMHQIHFDGGHTPAQVVTGPTETRVFRPQVKTIDTHVQEPVILTLRTAFGHRHRRCIGRLPSCPRHRCAILKIVDSPDQGQGQGDGNEEQQHDKYRKEGTLSSVRS